MPQLRHLAAVAASLATSLATVLVVASGAAPAHAGRQTTRDATHDVYRIPAGGTPALDPGNRKHDIVRAGTVHRGRFLTLWVEVRRLGRTAYIATWEVKTPDDRWVLHFDKRVGPAYTSLFHGSSEVLDCEGLSGRTVPRRDRVVVRVPRACIDRPRWIRFGSSFGHDTDDYIVIDDARIDAGFLANRTRLGPRVPHN